MARFTYRYLPTLGISAFEAYRRLGAKSPGFVLEGSSQEPGASRFSFAASGVSRVVRSDIPQLRDKDNPFSILRNELASLSNAVGSSNARQSAGAGTCLPANLAGVVGYFAYETAAYVEPGISTSLRSDPTGVPEAAFFAPSEMVVIDQWTGDAYVLVVSLGGNVLSTDLESRADEIAHRIGNPVPRNAQGSAYPQTMNQPFALDPLHCRGGGDPISDAAVRQRNSQPEYEAMVERARNAVTEGELIQVVLSERFERRTEARPIDIYRTLRQLNPSPYMYLLDFEDFQIVGASPELLVRVRDGRASIHPIAGTRPRGSTPIEDRALAHELRRSEKDRAEHLMLLDLARNDIGRVCKPGSVDVSSFMAVEYYSHVMHLVSRVSGDLGEGLDGLDALAAGFPAGTLTGAPKVRAMELIAELEPEGRGPYTGAVGWFGARGSLDSATIIRSIVLRDGIAHIQGGGGIVFDSKPTAEYLEAWHKMEAPLRAIGAAELLDSGPERITPEVQFSKASA